MNRLKKTIIIIGLVLAGSLLVTEYNTDKKDLSSNEDIIMVDDIAPRCSECNNQMQTTDDKTDDNKTFVCVNPSCDKFEDTIEFSYKD